MLDSPISSRQCASLLAMLVNVAATTISTRSLASEWDVAQTGQPSRSVQLALTEGTWMSLDVSPDGRTLMFDLLGDIYSLPADGGAATLVHGGPAMQRMPSFSPDGRHLLYMSDASGADNAWMSNPDGTQARQVTHERVNMLMSAAWAPSGDAVAAVKIYSTFARRNSSEAWLYDVAGGSGRVLVETPPSGRDVEELSFSPDGRFVYYTERLNAPFVYVDANQLNYAISRRDLLTGKSEQVVGGFGSATTGQISPDGQQLAFVRRVMNKTVLFALDLKSGAQRPVYAALDRDLHASYAPQASLATTRASTGSRTIAMSPSGPGASSGA